MYDPLSEVFTRLKIAIKAKCPNAGTTTSGTPPSVPYTGLKQLDNGTIAEDMENEENAVNSVIEVTVFSNKSTTEANTIMKLVCDCMRGLGYQRKGPYSPTNAEDTNVYRVIYRFNRVIGVGEKLQ